MLVKHCIYSNPTYITNDLFGDPQSSRGGSFKRHKMVCIIENQYVVFSVHCGQLFQECAGSEQRKPILKNVSKMHHSDWWLLFSPLTKCRCLLKMIPPDVSHINGRHLSAESSAASYISSSPSLFKVQKNGFLACNHTLWRQIH